MPETIRLYLDENVHKKVASSLRIRGYDVVSAHDLGKWGLEDCEQLEFAVSEERTIFTFDPRDFIKLHTDYINQGKTHYGIIVSNQITISETVNQLLRLLLDRERDQITNKLIWL